MKKLIFTLALCAISAFAQTDPLDASLKQVYRNQTRRTDGIYQSWNYTVILTQKISDTSGIFSVSCEQFTSVNSPTRRELDRRTFRKPQIVIVNCDDLSDMAVGDKIELKDKQTLWGLGTVTLWAKNKQRDVTLRQFSFNRSDAVAYLRAKRVKKKQKLCPTCGQPIPSKN